MIINTLFLNFCTGYNTCENCFGSIVPGVLWPVIESDNNHKWIASCKRCQKYVNSLDAAAALEIAIGNKKCHPYWGNSNGHWYLDLKL